MITDKGLGSLRGLGKLESMGLGGTKVGDEGARRLTECGALRIVDLTATAVTDEGLMALSKLGRLKSVQLWFTGVTEAGIEQFRKSVRDCEVGWRNPEGRDDLGDPTLAPRQEKENGRR